MVYKLSYSVEKYLSTLKLQTLDIDDGFTPGYGTKDPFPRSDRVKDEMGCLKKIETSFMSQDKLSLKFVISTTVLARCPIGEKLDILIPLC